MGLSEIFNACFDLPCGRCSNGYPCKRKNDKGKAGYKKRKWIAELTNGWIKSVLGFRQFSMRGLEKARAECKLVCLALNLRRMGAMQMV